MSDQELREQFQRCQEWNDPEQWELLAVAYWQRGYDLNALQCFNNAERCKKSLT